MVLVNIIHKESRSFFTCDFFITWYKMVDLRQSVTTTLIKSKALDLGRSVMKSIDIEDQGFFRIGNRHNNPYGR
jgi:hypothetical protein